MFVVRFSFSTCIFIHLLVSVSALKAQTILSIPQKKQYALELLKKYDPEGWYVVNKVTRLSINNNFDRYAEENTRKSVRESLGTVVHEVNHGYSALMAWRLRYKERDQYSCYYTGDSTYILVKHTPVFLTEEIGKYIRPELHTFRFDTYIYNSNEKIKITSNTQGIYGLLDEWNSYYHGTKTDVNMHKWYEENTKGTPEDWRNYFSTVGSVINAYIEFKFYCLAYLLYAKENKPEIYQGIINNKEFIHVFLTVNDRYGDLVDEYLQIKKNILKKLQSKGVKVSEDEEWIFINGEGTGNFVNEYKVLQKEINLPAYQEMLANLQLIAQSEEKQGR
jgi:hypothetical protein